MEGKKKKRSKQWWVYTHACWGARHESTFSELFKSDYIITSWLSLSNDFSQQLIDKNTPTAKPCLNSRLKNKSEKKKTLSHSPQIGKFIGKNL